MSKYHKPVLLHEVIEGLQIQQGAKYIDATVGGGGHTIEILKRGGRVLGIDVDEDALAFVRKEITNFPSIPSSGSRDEVRIDEKNLALVRGNFKDIRSIARESGYEKVSGILFDLGVSSFQLDIPEKGFSFLRDGPLDMRMDKTLQVSAADLIQGLRRNELVELFIKFGEERNARKIAQTITIERQFKKILTTGDLVKVIEKAYGVTNEVLSEKRHAQIAMRVFQALRIAVNDEMGVIKEALPKAIELLEVHGRLAVITFHSLEDRIVKDEFVEFARKGMGSVITKKPLIATEEEAQERKKHKRIEEVEVQSFEFLKKDEKKVNYEKTNNIYCHYYKHYCRVINYSGKCFK
jgi:16S rRNA (cytosine1402-N4)-methyltransferase